MTALSEGIRFYFVRSLVAYYRGQFAEADHYLYEALRLAYWRAPGGPAGGAS